MSQYADLLTTYYQGWKDGSFDPELFAEDFKFIGPLMQCNNRSEYFQAVQQMTQFAEVTDLAFKSRFFNDTEGTASTFYNFITTKPFEGTTFCAEFFTFQNGKIKQIELVYDARQWEKVMPAGAAA